MDRDTFSFVIYMIHKCADQWNISPAQAYEKLNQSGCISQYLVPHYEVLHTLDSGYVVEDIRQYLTQRGIAV